MVEKEKEKNLTKEDLNKAAELIALQLPDRAIELLKSIQKDHKIEFWQLICGILLEVETEGRLSAFTLDPSWEKGLKQEELICKRCGKKFKPRCIGQPYCSNECGLAAEEEKRKNQEKEKKEKEEKNPLKEKEPLEESNEPINTNNPTNKFNNLNDNNPPSSKPKPNIMEELSKLGAKKKSRKK